ncbi:MAG: hypothetical protein JW727_05550 [Candidatus Aenigmarchaeota archaeon]|nr:hypothetical protein [Candidatus Aenigmarchaeota archaeon]
MSGTGGVSRSQITFSSLFSTLPPDLTSNLETTYNQIIRNFHEGRFEPSELNGAKFCETVYRLLEWHTSSPQTYTPFGKSIRDFGVSTRKFESLSAFPDTIRFHIPKLMCALYDLRNKRGVGHMGGEINPNHMDSALVVQVSKWILADLVRIFHQLTLQEAQDLVEGIVAKEYSLIWKNGAKRRVLNCGLTYNQQVLALLYSEYPKPVLEKDLLAWVEYSNSTLFRNRIVLPLHKERLLEYDGDSKEILLSPKGIKFVEENIDLRL